MKLLLDTHVFIWLDTQPEKLSKTALSLCSDESNELYLSMASLWEMQIKNQLGKLNFEVSISDMLNVQQQDNDLKVLDIQQEHILLVQIPSLTNTIMLLFYGNKFSERADIQFLEN